MNKQLSALPDSKTTRITLLYNRQYVIFAVYEVLDKNGAEYEKQTHPPFWQRCRYTVI